MYVIQIGEVSRWFGSVRLSRLKAELGSNGQMEQG